MSVPLAQFSLQLDNFATKALPMLGQEYLREQTRDLMKEAHDRHDRFPDTGRLSDSTTPFVNHPGRGRGSGARHPSRVSPSSVDRLNLKGAKRVGIRSQATNPRNGYPYSRQIWAGRGFRAGQMRGSRSLRRGVAEIAEASLRRAPAAWRRGVATVQRAFPEMSA